MMMSVNLLLFAYAIIEVSSLWSIFTFFVTAFVLFGLKETAIARSDPFGMDAVDFETDVFMARIMINTKELISRQANYVPQTMPLPTITHYGEDVDGLGA